MLYQVTVVSVGAALTIGGQPIVDQITRPDHGNVFWHAGWRVSLGNPVLNRSSDTKGPAWLSIPAMFENLGDDTAPFDSQLVISTNGKHYTEPGPGQDLPTVPGKAEQAGTIAFTVDRSFDVQHAILTVGKPDKNQAVIPLGRSGRAELLEPQRVHVSGRVVIDGRRSLTVTGGELRADLPERHDEALAGRRFLTLYFTATNVSLIIGSDYKLRVPSGDERGHSLQCFRVSQYVDQGPNAICFEVDNPPGGKYAFHVGNEAGAFRFTLP